jgi:hypothetical protein
LGLISIHTGLGEEGAEALVRLGGFAFLGEEAIRLVNMSVYASRHEMELLAGYSPECHAPGNKAATTNQSVKQAHHVLVEITSQHELAIWQPAWPTGGEGQLARGPSPAIVGE